MSKSRLVITALFVDRQSPSEVAARFGVHRSWVYKLRARCEAEGDAAFEPRSRRPKSSPTATSLATVELILKLRRQLASVGLDACPDTIAWSARAPERVRSSDWPSAAEEILSKRQRFQPQPRRLRPDRGERLALIAQLGSESVRVHDLPRDFEWQWRREDRRESFPSACTGVGEPVVDRLHV